MVNNNTLNTCRLIVISNGAGPGLATSASLRRGEVFLLAYSHVVGDGVVHLFPVNIVSNTGLDLAIFAFRTDTN